MNLIWLYKGNDTNGEFLFSELIFEVDGERVVAICVEANELRLLVNAEKNIDEIVEEMSFDNGCEVETETINVQGEVTKLQKTINIEALFEYFMESDFERYECWKNDLGEEGLCEAAESEIAIPLLAAYDYLRYDSSDSVYKLLEAAESDCFFEEFDGSAW